MLKFIACFLVFIPFSIIAEINSLIDSTTVNKFVFNSNFTKSTKVGINDSIVDYHYYTDYRNSYSINKGYMGGNKFDYFPVNKFAPVFYINDQFSSFNYGNNVIYSSLIPVTSVFYMNTPSTEKEQYFNLFHTQKLFNIIGVNFNLIKTKSVGDYSKQDSKANQFDINLYYNSRKYSSLLSFEFNSINDSENGGVIFDSSYVGFKPNMSVNIDESYFNGKSNKIIFHQKIKVLNSNKFSSDSIEDKQRSNLYLFSNSEYTVTKREFHDLDSISTFYSDFFERTFDVIFDSIHYKSMSNSVGISNVNELATLDGVRNIQKYSYTGYLDIQNFKYLQNDKDTVSSNLFIGGNLGSNISKKVQGLIEAKYTLLGFNKNDFFANGNLNYIFSDSSSSTLTCGLGFSVLSPSYMYSWYNSSQLKWRNDFEKTNKTTLELSFVNKKYKTSLDLKYYTIGNHVYFDLLASSNQYKKIISVLNFGMDKRFTFFRKFNFNVNGLFQYSSVQEIYPLPSFSTKLSLYYQSFVFRKALLINFGVDCFYFNDYYAKSYFPLTGQLYLQNTQKIGNYPYFDAYVNAQIKSAKLFVKISHINSDLMGYQYYFIPNYPVRGRMVQLGVKWNFYH